MRRTLQLLSVLVCVAASGGYAAEGAQYTGRSLVAVLESFRASGLSIIYSTDLVKLDMHVAAEPQTTGPTEAILRELLTPFGLTLRRRGNDLLVVTGEGEGAVPEQPSPIVSAVAPPKLENVVVHASRYAVRDRNPVTSSVLNDSEIDQLVGTGREPLRAVGRLPGAAAAGLSSKQNIRGGEENEVLVVFDGVPLFEPFHLKDFQSIFSILDPRVVGGMEVYTGSFPAQYGDRLSGVINVMPQSAPDQPHHELSLDFFNVGAMSTGSYGGDSGNWLASARRGTLDLFFDVVQQDIGSPSYFDVLTQVKHRVGNSLTVSGSLMLADDSVSLNETDRETQATADHRTLHAWTAVEQTLSDELSQRTLLAWVDAENLRQGSVDRPGESVGDVLDRRRYRALHLKQDWVYEPSEQFLAQWGVDLRRVDARYRYRSGLQFFEDDLIAEMTGQTGRNLDLSVAPDGSQVGLYLTNRWRFASRWAAEVGLRWDQQSYIETQRNEQTSPRLSIMFKPGDNTTLRAGWGRFSQAQGVHELQIEDGITTFFPAQRSAHAVVGLDHKFENELMLRFEVYRKKMDTLRPRFENLFNQLELLPELSPDRIFLQPDSARASGAELLLQANRPNKSVGWWLGASVSSVKDSFGGISVPRSWDQKQSLNAGLNWRHGRWRADAVAHYHAGWPTTEITLSGSGAEAIPVLGARNALRLPDFFSLDLRVSRRKELAGNRALTLFFELGNATDRDNACCVDFSLEEDAAGSIFLEREYDNWLPVVPSLGVIWEF